MAKPKPKPDDPEQSRRFVQAAKELGSDDSGAIFEKAVRAAGSTMKKNPPPEKPKAGKRAKAV